jgi:hypothetical protein
MRGVKDFLTESIPAMIDYILIVSTPTTEANANAASRHERLTVNNSLRQRGTLLRPLDREAIPLLPHLLDIPKHLAITASSIIRNAKDYQGQTGAADESGRQLDALCARCFEIEEQALQRVSELATRASTEGRRRRRSRSSPQRAHTPTLSLPAQLGLGIPISPNPSVVYGLGAPISPNPSVASGLGVPISPNPSVASDPADKHSRPSSTSPYGGHRRHRKKSARSSAVPDSATPDFPRTPEYSCDHSTGMTPTTTASSCLSPRREVPPSMHALSSPEEGPPSTWSRRGHRLLKKSTSTDSMPSYHTQTQSLLSPSAKSFKAEAADASDDATRRRRGILRGILTRR